MTLTFQAALVLKSDSQTDALDSKNYLHIVAVEQLNWGILVQIRVAFFLGM